MLYRQCHCKCLAPRMLRNSAMAGTQRAARMGKLKRDKILKKTGGKAPEPGHRHHKFYRLYCKHCEGYF